MGFYIRKSFGFGPLRLNLSRSGLGASVGVKGARVGVGPRGTYIHAGRGGLYYRKSLGSGRSAPASGRPTPGVASTTEPMEAFQEIESGEITKLVDSSSVDLLQELNRVHVRRTSVTWVASAAVVLLAWLFLAGAPAGVWLAAIVVAAAALIYARHQDVTRGTAVLQYDLAPDAAAAFECLLAAFREIQACRGLWHLSAAATARDPKRLAGAEELLRA